MRSYIAAFDIGQEVYLKLDPDQRRRFITAVLFKDNCVMYEVSSFDSQRWFYTFEISAEKDVVAPYKNSTDV